MNFVVVLLGGNTNDLGLGPLDGVSHYDSLILSELLVPSKREHLLHNIDDIFGYESVRKGDYKLVKGIRNLFFFLLKLQYFFFL